MPWKTLDDMDLNGKVVLTRVDINVPMEGDRVTDTTRIDKIVPTVKDIQGKGGKVVLLAHFDRPKGKVVPEMSLRRVQPALEAALGEKVVFVERPDLAAIDALPQLGLQLRIAGGKLFRRNVAPEPLLVFPFDEQVDDGSGVVGHIAAHKEPRSASSSRCGGR